MYKKNHTVLESNCENAKGLLSNITCFNDIGLNKNTVILSSKFKQTNIGQNVVHLREGEGQTTSSISHNWSVCMKVGQGKIQPPWKIPFIL